MNSNYTSLGQYYKNQTKETFSNDYNSGKFEISRTSNDIYQDINIDSNISSNKSSMAVTESAVDSSGNVINGVLTIDADKLPDNFEIKSVDVSMNYGDKWSPSVIPFNNLFFTYDNKLKKIYIGKTNFFHNLPDPKLPRLRANSILAAQLKSVVLGVRDYTKSPMNAQIPFARFYITW